MVIPQMHSSIDLFDNDGNFFRFLFNTSLRKSTVMLSNLHSDFGNSRHRSGSISCRRSDISANDVARLSHDSKKEKKKKKKNEKIQSVWIWMREREIE